MVIVGNQPGIGRSLLIHGGAQRHPHKMNKAMSAAGAGVEAVFFCPHVPDDACTCRKPARPVRTSRWLNAMACRSGCAAAGDSVWDAQAALRRRLCAPSAAHRQFRNVPQWPAAARLAAGHLCPHRDLRAFADAILNEKTAVWPD